MQSIMKEIEEKKDLTKENTSNPSAFLRPFLRCWENGFYFSIWSAFTLIGGLLGTLFNLVQRCIIGEYSFQEALYIDSVSGSFYVFSIVLVSSVLAPIFLKFVKDKDIEFKKMKIGFVSVSIFVLIFGSVFYSLFTSKYAVPIPSAKLGVDWWQLSFFVISILIAVYSFGIKLIDDNPGDNDDIREKKVKKNVKKNAVKAKELTKAGDIAL